MLTIIKYSLKEMLNKKIFVATLVLALIFQGLYGGALYMVYHKGGNFPDLIIRSTVSSQLLGAGFYFSTFIIAFLTVLGGIGTISLELESGLLYTVLTKPITRTKFMLGKFTGLALMLIIFSVFMLSSVLILNIIMAGKVFYNFQIINIIKAVNIYFLIPLTLLAIVFFFSTRLKSLATGIVVIMLFMLGIIGGFLEQIGVLIQKQELVDIGILASLISPVDSMYRKFFSVLYDVENTPLSLISTGPFGSIHPPSGWMVIYTIVFILAFVTLAIRKFNRMDL
jgi:ABC-type transport system involved in multi-copper enzyme maturation permease subunit